MSVQGECGRTEPQYHLKLPRLVDDFVSVD